jgi:hypothetical protein
VYALADPPVGLAVWLLDHGHGGGQPAAGWPRASFTASQAPRSGPSRPTPTLIYFNGVEKGGHFAAWQEPELFANELRAAFRSLRDERRSS